MKDEIGGACSTHGRDEKCMRPIGRCRFSWGDNVKRYLREIVWEVVDWINLAQDRD